MECLKYDGSPPQLDYWLKEEEIALTDHLMRHGGNGILDQGPSFGDSQQNLLLIY